MIDVKSLRYNSIVRYEIDGNIEDFMVTAISEEGVTLKNDNHIVVFAKHEDIEPVILSESLLIDSGFELIEKSEVEFDDFHYPYFVREGVIILYNKTSETNVCFKAGYAEMRGGRYYATLCKWIDSVHQIQNFFYENTGKELPIKK